MAIIDTLRVAHEGRLYKLEDLPTEVLQEIYEKHKEGRTGDELDLALGSEAPIPDELLPLQTLRRVDQLLSARQQAEELGPLDGW